MDDRTRIDKLSSGWGVPWADLRELLAESDRLRREGVEEAARIQPVPARGGPLPTMAPPWWQGGVAAGARQTLALDDKPELPANSR